MKHAMKKLTVILTAMCVLAGNGAVLAAEGENPVVDVGAVETDNYYGVVANENIASGSEYVYTVTAGDGQQYSGSSNEPFGEVTVNIGGVDVDTSSTLPVGGVVVQNKTSSTLSVNVQNTVGVTDDTEVKNADASASGIVIDSTVNSRTEVSAQDVTVVASGDENANAQGVSATAEKVNTAVSLDIGNVTVSSVTGSGEPQGEWPKSNATGINVQNMGSMTVTAKDITVSASTGHTDIYTQATGIKLQDPGNTALTAGNISAKANNEAVGVLAQATNAGSAQSGQSSVTTVTVGDILSEGSSAKGLNVAASAGSIAQITAGNITAETSSYSGILTSATGISTTGLSEGVQGTLSVRTGDVTVSSMKTATGISVVTYGANDPISGLYYGGNADIETGKVSVTADNGESSGSKKHIYGIDASAIGSSISVKTGDITAAASSGAVGAHATVGLGQDESSQTGIPGTVSLETGNITATGQNSNGLLLQGEQRKENIEPSSRIQVVADGTVSGDEAAVKVIGKVVNSGNDTWEWEYDTDHMDLTVWAAKENGDGEIVRVVTVDNTGEQPAEIVNKDLSAALEKNLNYIVKVADAWSGRMSVVSTEKNRIVTIGEKDYFTANEGEDVTFRISLNTDSEELEGVYYNNDDASTLTIAGNLIRDDQGNYIFSMKRGGSMLLGLKLHTHTPGTAVTENYVAATCQAPGSYDSVVYCSGCGREMSRHTVTIAQLQHIPGNPVAENWTADGYDLATYCTMCGTELSRKHIPIDPQPPAPIPVPVPAPVIIEEFEAVDDQTVVNGVKAADRQPIGEVFAIMGRTLDAEKAVVRISHIDQLLTASELDRFDNLNAEDRLQIFLSVLSAGAQIQSPEGERSDEARALAEEIVQRIANMSEEERAALAELIRSLFDVKKEVIDGQEYDTICIELIIHRDGKEEEKERLRFFDDNGTWRLYRIEEARLYET